MQGGVNSGDTDAGSPVKIGGKYNSTKPTYTDGQRTDVQTGTRGAMWVELASPDSTSRADVRASADAVTAAIVALGANALGYTYNGTTWDRVRSASAANLSANTATGAPVVTGPGGWSIIHAPAANAQATASKAAGAAGVRHVCTAISATFVASTTAPAAVQVTVNVRDGATGAGTVIWTAVMSLPATGGASAAPVQLAGLNIVGSAATAMTIEFSAAGGANTVEAVSLSGYSTS